MKRAALITLPFLVPALLLFTGCATTSISNTGGSNPFYRGEIAEADLLGISSRKNITDETIRATLARSSRAPVRLRKGEHVLLIQSGAVQPDASLAQAFGKYWRVSPYSGQPMVKTQGSGIDPKALRLAAAQAGASKIVCVWGIVESAHGGTGLEPITWLPIVGEFLPGKRTITRLTLKGMVMDTASGAWQSHSTDPFIGSRMTAMITQDIQSATQITKLKGGAYEQLAERMMR